MSQPRKLPEAVERVIAASTVTVQLADPLNPPELAELRRLLEDVAIAAADAEREACDAEVTAQLAAIDQITKSPSYALTRASLAIRSRGRR